MARLNKSIIALTFKFDCDRFLRFRLATQDEINSKLAPDSNKEKQRRPGINLITGQGRKWESSCYDDVVKFGGARVHYKLGGYDKELSHNVYDEVTDLLEQLKKPTPPDFLIEAQFNIPNTLSEGLREAIDKGRLQEATGRPDLMWIEKNDGVTPLVKPSASSEYVIHIFDIKLAAEPSLRHFVEVTFYALGLQAWLDTHPELKGRYSVCAAGRVWPGTHTATEFQSLVATLALERLGDPLTNALKEITEPVPYEVYQPRLLEFLDRRLPRTLAHIQPEDASWHVGKKCQLCEYLTYCSEKAVTSNHLSQIVDLTPGQAQVLRQQGINNLSDLYVALTENTNAWTSAKLENHTLRAAESAILARTQSLTTRQVVPVANRRTASMPKFTQMSIYLTAHFDPGTGITFAFGAKKVYFHTQGMNPDEDHITVINDDISGNLSSNSERLRLIELCQRIQSWLSNLDAANQVLPDKYDKHKVQFYVWDKLEAAQLGRVIARHLDHPDVLAQASFLLRIFPPEDDLRSPGDWKAQPLTNVKQAVKTLLACPLPFDYTLLDVMNCIDPFMPEGEKVEIKQIFGFTTPLSDQIPLERAYELWQQDVILRKYDPTKKPTEWPKYSRDDLREELKKALGKHLRALGNVVRRLQTDHREKLLLKKEPFTLKAESGSNLPRRSLQMLTFERLNAVAAELENREFLSLPVDEREAEFHSIRGIRPVALSDPHAMTLIKQTADDPRYAKRIAGGYDKLLPFTFAQNSRDTRMREGAFTIVLRNEDSESPLEIPWYRAMGYKTSSDAEKAGKIIPEKYSYFPLKTMLQVTLAKIDTASEIPMLVLSVNKELFGLAESLGLIDMTKAMVLDPFHKDFSGEYIERALRAVGGSKHD